MRASQTGFQQFLWKGFVSTKVKQTGIKTEHVQTFGLFRPMKGMVPDPLFRFWCFWIRPLNIVWWYYQYQS